MVLDCYYLMAFVFFDVCLKLLLKQLVSMLVYQQCAAMQPAGVICSRDLGLFGSVWWVSGDI